MSSKTPQIDPSEPLIRYATEADVPLILSLIHELAAYEQASSSVKATETSLRSTLSFPSPSSSLDPTSNPSPFTPGYARTLLLFAPDAIPPSSTNTDIDTDAQPLTSLPQPQCAGLALFFTNYSTWMGAPGIYLEDLFIRPQYRRRGYASLLFRELGKEVKRIGGARLEWSVLKWNQPSIEFYEKAIGATMMGEWAGMRVEGNALGRLAEGNGREEG